MPGSWEDDPLRLSPSWWAIGSNPRNKGDAKMRRAHPLPSPAGKESEFVAWEAVGLSAWPPYDWGQVDPNTLGSPIIHRPGGAFVVNPEGEGP